MIIGFLCVQRYKGTIFATQFTPDSGNLLLFIIITLVITSTLLASIVQLPARPPKQCINCSTIKLGILSLNL